MPGFLVREEEVELQLLLWSLTGIPEAETTLATTPGVYSSGKTGWRGDPRQREGLGMGWLGPQVRMQGWPTEPGPKGSGTPAVHQHGMWGGQGLNAVVQASGAQCRQPDPPQTLSVKTTAISRTPGST